MSSWGLGWKRQTDSFRLSLGYGDLEEEREGVAQTPPLTKGPVDLTSLCKFRVHLEWSTGEDEEQVVLKLQSQLMVTLPAPKDHVHVTLEAPPLPLLGEKKKEGKEKEKEKEVKEGEREKEKEKEEEEKGRDREKEKDKKKDKEKEEEKEREDEKKEEGEIRVQFAVSKRREPLKVMSVSRTLTSGPQTDGLGMLARLLGSGVSERGSPITVAEELLGYTQHWESLAVLNLSGCSLSALPVDLSFLPMLEKIYLDNNKLSNLPVELGRLKHLRVLKVDNNVLVSIPAELKECESLIELSAEHNKLVRLLLDFRALGNLRILHLFGNPLEFLPEILPCRNLRSLSLANVRIDGDQNLSSVSVFIETENASYFAPTKHRLSAFFSLIFRFSSCRHPLLASALAKIAQDSNNCVAIGKDESAVRQLLSMMLSENQHVVEQACLALSSLASDTSIVPRLMKADIMQPIDSVLKSSIPELLVSVLQVVLNLAFASDIVAMKILTKEVLKQLKILCGHNNPEVQRLALVAVGNLAFCRENRHVLLASESLRDLLIRFSAVGNSKVSRAAARALAILGENELLRRAVKGRPVGKHGLCILSMDGGGMRGLATVKMLRKLEEGTGKRIHEIFDLICGTSTGGMLAFALGIKRMTLDECEEIYKRLGKLVFAEPIVKDNEAATWREKLDQLYKSSSQNFRVVVHGSKHNAEQFEHLLKEICADEDGDLLIDSAVKGTPKVFAVSTLVSVIPAVPFVFRNYQYPPGTQEAVPCTSEGPPASAFGTPSTATPLPIQIGRRRSAFIGSCKHRIWEAIRASSAAPYYLDDFSCGDTNRWQDGAIVANNPTIIAIREAQLLWPDSQIGCLVSVGCGNLPTKARGKGGWRYLDTGQVLIESACSVERVEEALDALLPMFPDIQYFRFNPVDDRCGMELDETDPAVWEKLEASTNEYIEANNLSFQAACNHLVPQDVQSRLMRTTSGRLQGSAEEVGPRIGWRKKVLLIEAWGGNETSKVPKHTQTLESFCSRHKIKLEAWNMNVGISYPSVPISTPFTSPLFTGSISTSPLMFGLELGLTQMGRYEGVPPLSLDGGQNHALSSKAVNSPIDSPMPGPYQLSGPVFVMKEKLQNSPHVGIVHLALQSDSAGLILSWRNDTFAVAEPGESAEAFLHNVMMSMFFSSGKQVKARGSLLSKISTIAGLVSEIPKFTLGGVQYSYAGRQTQVLSDDREIGAYLFQRTLPLVHLTPEDVRWMVGAWRERIVICTSKYGLPASLVKALLDAGAKAVIASSVEAPGREAALSGFASSLELHDDSENGRFVIGDDEDEDGETSSASTTSDWEDSDFETAERRTRRQESEEKDLASFVCSLYTQLFRAGVGADAALQEALEAHPKQRYKCYLPPGSKENLN